MSTANAAGGGRQRKGQRTAAGEADARPLHFDLSWHLPHLLRRAHFEAEARFAPVYGSEATSRQLALLVTVAQTPGATQSEVARQIGLDLNTCSDLVRRTCARGWLLRRRSAEDGRAFQLHLTPAGLRLTRDIAIPLAEPYAAVVSEHLSADERRRLAGLLRKMLGLHEASKRGA